MKRIELIEANVGDYILRYKREKYRTVLSIVKISTIGTSVNTATHLNPATKISYRHDGKNNPFRIVMLHDQYATLWLMHSSKDPDGRVPNDNGEYFLLDDDDLMKHFIMEEI